MTTSRTFGRRGIAQPKSLRPTTIGRDRSVRPEHPDSLDDNGGKLMLQVTGYAATGALAVLGLMSVGNLGPGTSVESKPAAVGGVQPAPAISEPYGATMLEYLKLRRGMTYPEVKRTIGCDGEILSQVDLGGTTSIMLKWEASNSLLGSMTTTFQNGRLVAWAQFGLR